MLLSLPEPARASAAYRLHLLGGFRLIVAGRAVEPAAWRLRKAQTLIKLLALAPGYALPREQVLDLLWPDLQPSSAANNLRVALHAARRTVAPLSIALRGGQLSLCPAASIWSDVAAFEQTAMQALHDADPMAGWTASELYTGDLLPDDMYEDWAAGRREALRRQYLTLLLALAGWERADGRTSQAIGALERLVAVEPSHEEGQQQLIRLYAQTGQHQRASRQYEHLCMVLRTDLGVEPDEMSQQLGEAIRDRQLSGTTSAHPPYGVATQPDSPGNLPAAITSFIGRTHELAELQGRLGTTRLLTLTGAGGCGKSRLALELAVRVRGAYPDGAWLVALAPLTDPQFVPQAVAQALGIHEQPSRPVIATLMHHLKPCHLLLLLDNCEHLLDACAALADQLLRHCPVLTILATSREPLGIIGEMAWRVPSLSLPPREPGSGETPSSPAWLLESDAAQLLIARAAEASRTFALTETTVPAVIEICHRLDGMPLALELAAARVRALSVEQIAARLDDRFRLLTTGNRTALPRHRTLWAAIDWSYELLTEPDRARLRRLAVFASNWGLAAAEAVCTDAGAEEQTGSSVEAITSVAILDWLARLVDKSLVQVEQHHGATRYRLLETVRHYAWERLQQAGEETALLHRLRDWYLKLVAQAEPALVAAEQLVWAAHLEAEHDNLRAVLAWSLVHDRPAALQLAGSLWQFWRIRGHFTEGRHWLDQVLAAASDPSPGRVKVLVGAGVLARDQGDFAHSRICFEASLALSRILGDRSLIAYALREFGLIHLFLGDHQESQHYLEQALALVRTMDDPRGLACTLAFLGSLAEARGDYRQARMRIEECLALLHGIGDRWLICGALSELGSVALSQGNYGNSRRWLDEALEVAQELGSIRHLGIVHLRLGDLARMQGEMDPAMQHYEASLALVRQLEDRDGMAWNLAGSGRVASAAGDVARARRLLEESLMLFTGQGNARGIGVVQHALGLVAFQAGDMQAATALLQASLASRREVNDRPGIAACLEGLGWISAAQAESIHAATLLGAADRLRSATNAPQPAADQGAQQAALQAIRAQLGGAAFARGWTAGQALSLEQAIAIALAR